MNCLCVLTWIAYMVMVRFVVKEGNNNAVIVYA